MAFLVEVVGDVGDVGVGRGEFLQSLHLPEPEHGPFSSSEGQVTVLHPVVGVPTDLLFLAIAEFAHRCAVGLQPIGNDRRW